MVTYVRIPVGQAEAETRRQLEAIRPKPDTPACRLIRHLRSLVPFDHIMITGLDVEGHNVGSGVHLLCDFPVDFMAEYYGGNYFPHDPLVAQFRAGKLMVRDSDVFDTAEDHRAGREVLALLRRHNIAERTAVAVRNGVKVIGTVALIGPRRLDDAEAELVQHMAMSLHTAVAAPALDMLNKRLKLTRGELLCLGGAASGQTSEDIAAATGYSLETVNSYLKSAGRKLGAGNRTHAVAEAIRRQLIG